MHFLLYILTMYILWYCPEWLGIIAVVIFVMKFPSQLGNNNNQTFR